MTQSNQALSRFKSQESANRAPGSCITCKSSKGPFVGTGIQLFSYGTVYICRSCIREMADNLGLFEVEEVEVIPPDIEEVREVVDGYVTASANLSALLLIANERVNDLLAAIPNENPSDDPEQPVGPIDGVPKTASSKRAAGVPSDSSERLLEFDGPDPD